MMDAVLLMLTAAAVSAGPAGSAWAAAALLTLGIAALALRKRLGPHTEPVLGLLVVAAALLVLGVATTPTGQLLHAALAIVTLSLGVRAIAEAYWPAWPAARDAAAGALGATWAIAVLDGAAVVWTTPTLATVLIAAAAALLPKPAALRPRPASGPEATDGQSATSAWAGLAVASTSILAATTALCAGWWHLP